MSCSEYEHLIQGYVDQTLTEIEKEQLNNHIFQCNSCKEDLHDMIEVVSFIEEMKEIDSLSSRNNKKNFSTKILSTCVAVCSAMMFTFYFPFESNSSETMTNFEQRNFVLVDESESLPIPNHQTVVVMLPRNKSKLSLRKQDYLDSKDSFDTTWVYPSAYTHLNDFEWDGESEQFVLIDLPNRETLLHILQLLNKTEYVSFQDQYQFPISVLIANRDKEFQIQPIHINVQEKGINPLFEQLNKLSLQFSH